MPSPFPGMDPYLEDPRLWPDFHDRLAEQISAILNRHLPAAYCAQLGSREEVGALDERAFRRIVPDVSLRSVDEPDGGVAVARPRSAVDEYFEIEVEDAPFEVNRVEIRDVDGDHEIVTVIEILSPSSKRGGADRRLYLEKRGEIDLLRHGGRAVFGTTIDAHLSALVPPPDYVVVANRAWRRGGRTSYQVFPATLRSALPVIEIPLREGETEVTLDLQYAVEETYDRGPVRRRVDYDRPLDGDEDVAAWARECVERARGDA